VRDASGAAVADARVSLRGDGAERATRTGPDGRFSFAERGSRRRRAAPGAGLHALPDGNRALSGVIHLVRKRADQTRVDVDASYGSQSTPDGSVAASLRRGSWGLRLHGTSFSTDGYVLVAPAERGRVDTPATSRHDGVELAVERGPDGASRQFAAISAFRESRGNGTPLQTNDTRLRQWSSARTGPRRPR